MRIMEDNLFTSNFFRPCPFPIPPRGPADPHGIGRTGTLQLDFIYLRLLQMCPCPLRAGKALQILGMGVQGRPLPGGAQRCCPRSCILLPAAAPGTDEVSKLGPGQCKAAPAASITSRLGDTFPGLGDTPEQGCTPWCWAPGAASMPRALLQHQLLGDTGDHPNCHTRAVLNTRRRRGFFCIIKPCRRRNCPLSHDDSFWNSSP